MVQEVKCPKCGETDYIVDTDNCGFSVTLDKVRFYYEGYCKHCQTSLRWAECYTFEGYDEIEED